MIPGLPTAAEWATLARLASPLIAILAAACVALAISAFADEEESRAPAWISIAGFVAAFVLAWRVWPETQGVRIAMLSLDRLSLVSWMIISAAGIFASSLSLSTAAARPADDEERPGSKVGGDYFALISFCAFGMGVLVAAGDMVAVLIGLETMSLAAYALTAYPRRAASVEGALKYFLMGAFATAFFAMGIAFIIGSAGTTDLAMLSERAGEIARGEGRTFFLFGCAMATIGFAFKVAAVPFHAWTPDAYEGAPVPVTTLMATGIKVAAFVALARFAFSAAAHAGLLWHHLIFAIAAATMFLGNLAAIKQESLRRMLAYSSIAHAGYLLVIFPSLLADPAGSLRAVILYLIAYVLMTAGAFAAVAAIEGESKGDLRSVSGLGKRRPWLAATFTLFLISLAGFPPTLGFFGKYYLFAAAIRGGDALLVVIALIASVVSVYYYLRPVAVMYFHDKKAVETDVETQALSPSVVAVMAAAAAAVILFGIFPGNLVALIQGTVF